MRSEVGRTDNKGTESVVRTVPHPRTHIIILSRGPRPDGRGYLMTVPLVSEPGAIATGSERNVRDQVSPLDPVPIDPVDMWPFTEIGCVRRRFTAARGGGAAGGRIMGAKGGGRISSRSFL
jgi:hypothetical protein